MGIYRCPFYWVKAWRRSLQEEVRSKIYVIVGSCLRHKRWQFLGPDQWYFKIYLIKKVGFTLWFKEWFMPRRLYFLHLWHDRIRCGRARLIINSNHLAGLTSIMDSRIIEVLVQYLNSSWYYEPDFRIILDSDAVLLSLAKIAWCHLKWWAFPETQDRKKPMGEWKGVLTWLYLRLSVKPSH